LWNNYFYRTVRFGFLKWNFRGRRFFSEFWVQKDSKYNWKDLEIYSKQKTIKMTFSESQKCTTIDRDISSEQNKLPSRNSYFFLIIIFGIELMIYYYQNLTYQNFLPYYEEHEGSELATHMTSWKCALYYLGANTTPAIMYKYQIYRLFTSLFLHHSAFHLVSNCMTRFLFYASLREYFGAPRIIGGYF
jgi:membrane associated rhomboid family serine protease